MKVKYNRISTQDQNINRQNLNINNFDLTINEISSGSISFFERKGGIQFVNLLTTRSIKELHITSIDRLGRDILNILEVVKFLTDNNINLFVENLGLFSLINSKPNPSFKLIVSVLGSVAELERENILERQKQGIEIAKAKGIYKGRKKGTKISDSDFIKKYNVAYNELKAGSTLKRASLLGECSIHTCQRLKKLL